MHFGRLRALAVSDGSKSVSGQGEDSGPEGGVVTDEYSRACAEMELAADRFAGFHGCLRQLQAMDHDPGHRHHADALSSATYDRDLAFEVLRTVADRVAELEPEAVPW